VSACWSGGVRLVNRAKAFKVSGCAGYMAESGWWVGRGEQATRQECGRLVAGLDGLSYSP
jgi:hypothetical protein